MIYFSYDMEVINMNKNTKRLIEIILFFLIVFLVLFFIYKPKIITLYGQRVLANKDVINLENISISSYKELDEKLNKFSNLKVLNLGDNIITEDYYKTLKTKYPDLEVNAIIELDIYNNKVLSNAEYLDLSEINIDNNIYGYFDKMPNLKKVNLTNQKFDLDEQLKMKEKYPHIDFEWSILIASKYVDSNVTELNLDNEKIEDIDKLYKSLKLFNNLTYLDMGYSNLKNEELDKINNDFKDIKIVWKIKFGPWHIKTDDIAFSVLISNFPYKRLTSDDLHFLKYCKDLQALDLGHQNITDLNVIADNLPNLRLLILADNKISDISPLTKLKNLHYVELFMNNIHDFSPIAEMPSLVDVNISFNRFQDITPLKNLPKLERLWVVGCSLNKDKITELRKIYPNATVNINGPGSTEAGWRTHERYYKMIDMFHKRNYISELFTKYD